MKSGEDATLLQNTSLSTSERDSRKPTWVVRSFVSSLTYQSQRASNPGSRQTLPAALTPKPKGKKLRLPRSRFAPFQTSSLNQEEPEIHTTKRNGTFTQPVGTFLGTNPPDKSPIKTNNVSKAVFSCSSSLATSASDLEANQLWQQYSRCIVGISS